MKLLFLGASSFTGYHFVKKISETNKFKIYCTLTKNLNDYRSERLERIRLISKNKIKLVKDIRFDFDINLQKYRNLINSI